MILHTDRSEEAYRLIKRAYLLNPGDPAIIDSMGWVLFVMGKAEEALSYLQKAMAILPDPEIAAHLGEVHWYLGEQQAALQIWQQGLAQSPDHPTIVSTMERLGAEMPDVEAPDPDGLNLDAIDPSAIDPSTIDTDSDVDSAAIIDASHTEQNQ